MKKLYLFIFSALICAALSNCSTIDIAVSKKVDLTEKISKVAVFPFDIKDAEWGDEFADSITHYFFKTGKIDVAEREAIEKILKEQGLSMSGAIDQKKAAQIGKLLGVDIIIMGRGSALRFSNRRGKPYNNLIDTFSLKAVSVETGELLITVRKEPGRAWNAGYRMKYCFSGSLIWSRDDILVESSEYDDIACQVVDKIMESIKKLEMQKSAAAAKAAKQ